jgi:hypothetical protein
MATIWPHVRGSKPPEKELLGLFAPFASPRRIPRLLVNKLTVWEVSE